jgi:hypothetical protein
MNRMWIQVWDNTSKFNQSQLYSTWWTKLLDIPQPSPQFDGHGLSGYIGKNGYIYPYEILPDESQNTVEPPVSHPQFKVFLHLMLNFLHLKDTNFTVKYPQVNILFNIVFNFIQPKKKNPEIVVYLYFTSRSTYTVYLNRSFLMYFSNLFWNLSRKSYTYMTTDKQQHFQLAVSCKTNVVPMWFFNHFEAWIPSFSLTFSRKHQHCTHITKT